MWDKKITMEPVNNGAASGHTLKTYLSYNFIITHLYTDYLQKLILYCDPKPTWNNNVKDIR